MRKSTLFMIGILIGFTVATLFIPIFLKEPELKKLEKQKTQLEIEYLQIQLDNHKRKKFQK